MRMKMMNSMMMKIKLTKMEMTLELKRMKWSSSSTQLSQRLKSILIRLIMVYYYLTTCLKLLTLLNLQIRIIKNPHNRTTVATLKSKMNQKRRWLPIPNLARGNQLTFLTLINNLRLHKHKLPKSLRKETPRELTPRILLVRQPRR